MTAPAYDLHAIGEHGFVLTVTPRQAMDSGLAEHLCATLEARAGFTVRDPQGLRIALHEAIANAVLHGCLRLPSGLRDTTEGHDIFARMVTDRLDDPAFSEQTIAVEIRWRMGGVALTVTDPGPGYRPQAPGPLEGNASASPTRPGAPDMRRGRGLDIIRALADEMEVQDKGRRIVLWFGP